MIEYHDRIALKPIEWSREFVGLLKVSEEARKFLSWEEINPMLLAASDGSDVWVIAEWKRFENGDEECLGMQYIADATESEVREAYNRHLEFLLMSKEKLLELQKCFKASDEDRDYVAERFPLMPPDPKSIEEHDLYQARLKMLAGMQPMTVRLIEEADATNDSVRRGQIEFEAVSAYYAEQAHYWNSDAVKDWQRNNPIAREWIGVFADVFKKPRRKLDAVDHAVVLGWIRKGYNLMTAGELSDAIFQATGERISADTIKKRRERLGLTTKRGFGPRPNWEK